ncbi:hypothetical protein [Rosenbergiella metrosideri]|uniref:hypothetical protein n=1 Tax=Rosenbergiella metrosideri TaxID=2921185 RepID=UPI001F4F7F44|nr:hypothetical protein [Rosenbergiella metrosideri]
MAKGFEALSTVANSLEQQIWAAAENNSDVALEILANLAMRTMLRAESEDAELEFLGMKVQITLEVE